MSKNDILLEYLLEDDFGSGRAGRWLAEAGVGRFGLAANAAVRAQRRVQALFGAIDQHG
jgi:hypothetical protein